MYGDLKALVRLVVYPPAMRNAKPGKNSLAKKAKDPSETNSELGKNERCVPRHDDRISTAGILAATLMAAPVALLSHRVVWWPAFGADLPSQANNRRSWSSYFPQTSLHSQRI